MIGLVPESRSVGARLTICLSTTVCSLNRKMKKDIKLGLS
jgi:hypothetical protein